MQLRQDERSDTRRLPLAVVCVVFLAVALISRWRVMGDPIITGVDEQFYVLVANRMLHGATLYVDLWDRKPVGLFLIYALGGMFGNVLLGSQILALLVVTATATILYNLARKIASSFASVLAGLIYIVFLPLAGGEGGQAPVFYNLLVVGAIAWFMRARRRPAGATGDLRIAGAACMLLFGLALQIKYTVVFEGMFLGLALLYTAWSRKRPIGALVLDAAIWVACALAPTAAAALYYAAVGHFDDWLFANFISIGMRGSEPARIVTLRLVALLVLLAPLLGAWILRLMIVRRPTEPIARADAWFLDAWTAAAVAAVMLFGTWYGHYALPLFAPLAVAAAPLGRLKIGRICLVLLFAYGAVAGQVLGIVHAQQRGDARLLTSATAAVARQRNCMFIYDGPVSLYDASGSCLPSSRPFPENLRLLNEHGAVGLDEVAEVRRIMANRPERVMLRDPAAPEDNPATGAILNQILRRDYIATWRYPVQGRDYVIYSRRDANPPPAAPAAHREEAKRCRDAVAPPWSEPVRAVTWHLAPIMGACI